MHVYICCTQTQQKREEKEEGHLLSSVSSNCRCQPLRPAKVVGQYQIWTSVNLPGDESLPFVFDNNVTIKMAADCKAVYL